MLSSQSREAETAKAGQHGIRREPSVCVKVPGGGGKTNWLCSKDAPEPSLLQGGCSQHLLVSTSASEYFLFPNVSNMSYILNFI